jgi:hypothetical protein
MFAPDWSGDSRFVGIYNFEGGNDGADSSTHAHTLTPASGPPLPDTVNFWQGVKALDWSNGTTSTSTASAAFQSLGDFTAGLALEPPGGGITSTNEFVMGTETTPLATADGWLLFMNSSRKMRWQIYPNLAELVSDDTYTNGAFFTAIVRFTNSSNLMEMFMMGLLQGTTHTATNAPGATSIFQLFSGGGGGGAPHAIMDEAWVFAGKMLDTDVQRIHVCGIDGKQCVCAGNTVFYASPPPRLGVGMSLPACNKAGPT